MSGAAANVPLHHAPHTSLASTSLVSHTASFIEDNHLHIVLEYCENGDLAGVVKRLKASGQYLSETTIMRWFVQLCSALYFVHKHRILHRDVRGTLQACCPPISPALSTRPPHP